MVSLQQVISLPGKHQDCKYLEPERISLGLNLNYWSLGKEISILETFQITEHGAIFQMVAINHTEAIRESCIPVIQKIAPILWAHQ